MDAGVAMDIIVILSSFIVTIPKYMYKQILKALRLHVCVCTVHHVQICCIMQLPSLLLYYCGLLMREVFLLFHPVTIKSDSPLFEPLKYLAISLVTATAHDLSFFSGKG